MILYFQYSVQTYVNEVEALTIDQNPIEQIVFNSEAVAEEDYEPTVIEVGVEPPTWEELYTFKVYNLKVEAPEGIQDTLIFEDLVLNDDGTLDTSALNSSHNITVLENLWEGTIIGEEIQ